MGRYTINWVNDLPKLEFGESPYAVLRFAFIFNGEKLIEDIDDYDVSCPLKPFFSHAELGTCNFKFVCCWFEGCCRYMEGQKFVHATGQRREWSESSWNGFRD